MSEYWVSHKKYFCRYCEIYIADDVPSRQHHENGLRHKGNMERFIRSLYKAGEKKKKDLEEEKREMARVEQAAQAAFSQDVGAGIAKLAPQTTPKVPASATPRKPPSKPSNPYTNYSTAASLGYQDLDVEKAHAEAERRRSQGVVGDWEVIAPAEPPSVDAGPSTSSSVPDVARNLKREVEPTDNDRHFKLRKKTVAVGLGELYDPGIIPIKVKKKEEPVELAEADAGGAHTQSSAPLDPAPSEPKWTKGHWRSADIEQEQVSPGEGTEAGARTTVPDPPDALPHADVKPDVDTKAAPPLPHQEGNSVKLEDPSSFPAPENGNSLFRKRKTPGGAVRGKRQIEEIS